MIMCVLLCYPVSIHMSQLQATERPISSFQPVVIPALKPSLDYALVPDKFLCPVRALRGYLDKSKDLRKGKKILFVAIKKGYSKI